MVTSNRKSIFIRIAPLNSPSPVAGVVMRGIGIVPEQWRRPSSSSPPLPLRNQSKRQPSARRRPLHLPRFARLPPRRSLRRRLLILFAFLALLPPLFFHFRLRRLQQARQRKCGWLENPPMVCAHGGDSSKAAPNTMEAFRLAISEQVDCIEVDVSRSSDGVLFALHDRDLQRMSGNDTAKVGHMSANKIKELDAGVQLAKEFRNQKVPAAEDALTLISHSVKQLIVDVKVGPPLFEKGLAHDLLSIVKKTHCKSCLIWAKSDILASDVIKLSKDVPVGYIVMKDPSTGAVSNLLRMRNAAVVGVYHHLIDEKLVKILHGNDKKVYAWTVDDVESMKKVLSEGVDAVITSNPTLLQDLMQDIRTECLQEGFHSSMSLD